MPCKELAHVLKPQLVHKNQNIVSSREAMTLNCNTSKPEFAHVNAEILLDAKTMQYRHTHHVC